MSEACVLFRSNGDGRLAAVVRTDDGVFDLDRRSDDWRCSCGRLACAHARALRASLSSASRERP